MKREIRKSSKNRWLKPKLSKKVLITLNLLPVKKAGDLTVNLICLTLFLSSTNIIASEKEEWTLKIQQDGIAVYTKKVAGSRIDAFKATTMISAEYEKVKEVILDYPNYPKWYQDYKAGEILEQTHQDEIVVRFIINAPFPIKDRDSVNRVYVRQTDEHIEVILESAPTFIPRNKKQIRMTISSGRWTLEKEGNQTRVTLEYHADPEIPVPSWVSNRYVVQGPAKSLSNLKKRLQ